MLIAIIERLDDVECKLVVVPYKLDYANNEIEVAVSFQKKYFKHRIIR